MILVGIRRTRKYGLYVCATQDMADSHLQNIAAKLESPTVAERYPGLGERSLGKFGPRAWRRNRLWTASGLVVDAAGFDTAVRGLKVGDRRPDFIILDDIDEVTDSPTIVEAKEQVLTKSIIPAGTVDAAVAMVENLIHDNSIMSRLTIKDHQFRADYLSRRIISGPIPAVWGLVVDERDGRNVIVAGEPSWPEGMNLEECQFKIDDEGLESFKTEHQQDVQRLSGSLFADVKFQHCTPDQVPPLVVVVVWVDPAITNNDRSDCNGIIVDGLGVDDKIYRLWAWERRASPEEVLALAIEKAIEFDSDTVGVETDQGGDTWKTSYYSVADDMLSPAGLLVDGERKRLPPGTMIPEFVEAKAGSGYGNKMHRANQMKADYKRNRFIHVINEELTHEILERAMRRYGRVKPYDLVDAAFWGWNDLKDGFYAGPLGAAGGKRQVSAAKAS